MAFASVASSTTGQDASNTTTRSVTFPSGVVAGNLLLVALSCDGINNVATTSTGWAILGQVNSTASVTGAILWKVATGSDALTVTSSSERCSWVSLRIANGGTPTATSSTNSSTNSDPPLHTPPGGAADYLWIATRHGDDVTAATAAPTNYSNLLTVAGTGSGPASTNTAERQLNAASENPGAFTSAVEQWACWTVAVPYSASGSSVSGTAAATLGGLSGTAAGAPTTPGNIPTRLQSATGFAAAGVQTLSATLPAGATAGNLLVFYVGGDKDLGTLTMPGWSTPVNLRSTSVSLIIAWKTAVGGETLVSGTVGGANSGGSNTWVAEYRQDGTGAWQQKATPGLNNTTEATVTTLSSGTTGTLSDPGLAIAAFAVDSVMTSPTVSYTNQYLGVRSMANGNAEAGLWVATRYVTAGTTSTTINRDPAATGTVTADQMSGGVVVLGRTPATEVLGTAGAALGGLAATGSGVGAGSVRLYLTNTTSPLGSVGVDSSWDDSSNMVLRALGTAPAGAAATVSDTETTAATDWDVLLGAWVSPPLSGSGTIASGTQLVVTFLRSESDAAADLFTRYQLLVVSSDGSTVRGSLRNVAASSGEWIPDTLTALQLGSAATATVNYSPGDRLLLYLGYRGANTVTTSYTGTIGYGGTGTPDLVPGVTDTARPGWFAIGAPLSFAPVEAGAATATLGALTTVGSGTRRVSGSAGLVRGVTATGAGTRTVRGVAATTAAVTATGVGRRTSTGTAASSAALAASGVGRRTVPAVGVASLGTVSATGVGARRVTGVMAAQLGVLRAAASAIPTGFAAAPLGGVTAVGAGRRATVGSSRVDLQACKLEYSIVSPK